MDDLDLVTGNVVCKVGVGKLEPAREIFLREIARAEVHIFIVVVLLIGFGIELGIVDRQGSFARKRLIDMNLTVAADIGRIDALRLGRSDLRVAGERHRTKGVNRAALRVLNIEFLPVIIAIRRLIQIVDSRALDGARSVFRHRNAARHMHLVVSIHVFAGAVP